VEAPTLRALSRRARRWRTSRFHEPRHILKHAVAGDVCDKSDADQNSIVRGSEEHHNPGAEFRLEPGDLLIVRGEHHALDQAHDLIAGSVATERG
jgi:Trk K+ transport system NAD-binding subunit